jgi:hypothetical protein
LKRSLFFLVTQGRALLDGINDKNVQRLVGNRVPNK